MVIYSAALIVALVGLLVLLTLITLLLLETFDDRYKEPHHSDIGQSTHE
jgi:hypothetical protein